MVRAAYRRAGLEAEVEPFLFDMGRRIATGGPDRVSRRRDDAGGDRGGRQGSDSDSAADAPPTTTSGRTPRRSRRPARPRCCCRPTPPGLFWRDGFCRWPPMPTRGPAWAGGSGAGEARRGARHRRSGAGADRRDRSPFAVRRSSFAFCDACRGVPRGGARSGMREPGSTRVERRTSERRTSNAELSGVRQDAARPFHRHRRHRHERDRRAAREPRVRRDRIGREAVGGDRPA